MHAPVRRFALLTTLVIATLGVAGCSVANSSLAGPTWQWTSTTLTSPASQSVTPDPQNYTVTFKTDGTVSIKADCNQVNGIYAIEVPLGVTITLGASTMVACGEDSLSDTFLEQLTQVAEMSVANGQLNLELAEGAGAMQFRAAEL